MAFDIRVHFNFENRESGLLGGIIPTVLSDSSAGLWILTIMIKWLECQIYQDAKIAPF